MAEESNIKKLAEAIEAADHVACLTGAGISTLSGIPDFRSPDQEIWTRHTLDEVFDIEIFRRDPDVFHRFANDCLASMPEIFPNIIHRLLGRLQQRGKLKSVATQNIDGLHQRGGSPEVLELHGSIASGRCLSCEALMTADDVLAHMASPPTPRCASCGGVLKPDIIFYGEMLPEQTLYTAMQEARLADLYLVFGSSLMVTPAAILPQMAVETGARLVIVNRDPTPSDDTAWMLIREDMGTLGPQLAELLGESNLLSEEDRAPA